MAFGSCHFLARFAQPVLLVGTSLVKVAYEGEVTDRNRCTAPERATRKRSGPYHQWGPVSTLARAKQPPGKHHLPGKCPGKYLASGTCRPLLVLGGARL